MFKPLEVFIGLRYVRAKRRNHFISFISLISMLGIALGIWALITVLSVMNGFEKELRDRILGMASHASIEGVYKNIEDWKPVAEAAYGHPMVLGAAPYIEGQAMLSGGKQSSGVIIRGIIPAEETKVSEVGSKMIAGSLEDLKPGEFGIVLGSELARNLLGTTSLDRLHTKKEKSVLIMMNA